MSKPIGMMLTFRDDIERYPVAIDLKVQLWDYPTTISDGTVMGNQSVDFDGNLLIGENLGTGRFLFVNFRPGLYTALVSGSGTETFIPVGLDKIDTGLSALTTGADIPWSDSTSQSIYSKIKSMGG